MTTTARRTQSSLGPAEELGGLAGISLGTGLGRHKAVSLVTILERGHPEHGVGLGEADECPCPLSACLGTKPSHFQSSAASHHNSSKSAFRLLMTYYVPVSWLDIFCPALVYKPHDSRCCDCLVDTIVPGM